MTYLTIETTGAARPTAVGTPKGPKFHASGFGGINNIAQPGGAKAHAAGLGLANDPDLVIPTSNLGREVQSMARENVINHRGHYVHDEHRSPYASHLYDQPKDFLDEQQAKYRRKMEAVRQEWGAWSDIEDDEVIRPVADFSNVRYRDLQNSDFPENSWQTDEAYIGKLLPEARALLNRVTEGIYAEYGHPLKQTDGTILSPEQKAERDAKFQIVVLEPNGGEPLNPRLGNNGIAWLTKPAMDALVRKLLHALITNDEFYVVLGGHSAAAGHGNNFMQNKVMTMHYILEPVFDKLGMRLMSRNMAMGGVGTLHFSFAGKDLYGETDIMLWDSGMTEKGGPVDFYNKQAILAGERMPILFTSQRFDIMKETQGEAWIGDFNVNLEILQMTTDEAQASEVPYAIRYLHAEPHIGKIDRFNAICWEPRSDITPMVEQSKKVGSQVGWHPGFRWHQYEGRVLALVLLEGLTRAFDLWEEGIAKDGFPLAEKYWHVGEEYERVREKLRTHVNTPTDDGSPRSACETFLPEFARMCRVAMHGYGLWTPRIPNKSFLDLIEPAPNGYKPTYSGTMAYAGFDVLPLVQAIPDGEVDVHAIAIATTNTPPDINHDWIEDDTDSNVTLSDQIPTRRWLRSATETAWRQGLMGPSDYRQQPWHTHSATVDAPIDSKRIETSRRRKLETSANEEIIPGRGWELGGWTGTNGFCDGSSMSACGRDNAGTCLALGHNDYHVGLLGNTLSGWLVFVVPKVKEGIILARLEAWCQANPLITQGWTEVNDGKTNDTTPYTGRVLADNVEPNMPLDLGLVDANIESDAMPSSAWNPKDRKLRKRAPPAGSDPLPADLVMDISINGKISTMQREEWLPHAIEHSKNCAVWPLLNDEAMAKREDDWEGEDIEVAIRFRSEINPRAGYCISHVFFA
jgi:hypothetical protein